MIKIFLPTKQRKKIFRQTLNNNAPKELFYGILASNLIDFNKDCIDTRNFINSKFEKICDILINSSFSKKKFVSLTSQVSKNAKILSFTDWDSINFGYHKKLRNDLTLIGGFHGLFDFYERTKNNIFFNKKKIFKKAIENLDHLFFFGSEDREKSIEFFKIKKNKTSVFNFGVDTDFWHKDEGNLNEEYDVFSVGSDKHRDYSLLNGLNLNYKFLILTKLKVNFDSKNFQVISGSKEAPRVTDEELRKLYNRSKIVLVPLRQTYQPSGQSAVLQAMACGKVVILTETNGIWDRKLFEHEKNIILIKPYDKNSLKFYLEKLVIDKKLRDTIGNNARNTAKKSFSLNRMNDDFKKLILF